MEGGFGMLNQSVLIGRLVKDPELYETDKGNKVTRIVLAVNRTYKNPEGTYDVDYIPCVLWKGIAERTVQYCKKGDLVSVKGTLQSSSYDRDDGSRVYRIEIVVDKVTFLSTKVKETE